MKAPATASTSPGPPSASPFGGDLSGPALRTFFRIAEAWKLRTDDARRILGQPPRSTYFQWKQAGEGQLSRDTLERISYVLGIYKALQILLPDPAAADAWIHKPNAAPLLNGQSALERMRSGNVSDLYVIRQYLDGQRGG
jgi:hypothetical protein